MITYDMLRNGLRDVSYSEWSYREKIDAKTEMESADIVIASEPGTGMVTTIFSSADKQLETLSIARNSDKLTQIASIPTKSGARFFVFAKNSYLASLDQRSTQRR
jgi:hypothetical protein